MKVLETQRLSLRRLVPSDAAFMLGLLNDPAWIRYIGDRGVRTVEGAREYLETRMISMYERLGFGLWMVEHRAGHQPMGICGLVKRDTLPEVDFPGLRMRLGQNSLQEKLTAQWIDRALVSRGERPARPR